MQSKVSSVILILLHCNMILMSATKMNGETRTVRMTRNAERYLIRKLWSLEVGAFRRHLLRLDPETRQFRFGTAVNDNFLHAYVTHGLNVRRSEEYSLALFPLWIQAVLSVISGMQLKFSVTPKERQSGNHLRLVWAQALIVALTVAASIYGLVSLWQGWNPNTYGVLINVVWGLYNTYPLSRIIRAAVYAPPADWQPQPPDFLFPAK